MSASAANARAQLTTGLVGGWLVFAGLTLFVGIRLTDVIMHALDPGRGYDDLDPLGSLGLLGALAWLGGTICLTVGWFGMWHLTRRPRFKVTAWMALAQLVGLLAAFNVRGSGAGRAVLLATVVLVAAHYGSIGFAWRRHPRHPRLVRVVVIAASVAGASMLLSAILSGAGVDHVIVVPSRYLAAVALAATGLVSGILMGRERASVTAAATFE